MSKTAVMRIYLAAVMVVLSFIAYKSYTTPMPTRPPDAQKILDAQVPKAQPGPPPTATPVGQGEALAYMEIPRFGGDWFWTTLEGTDDETLAKGPGHFPETELPGERGNVVYAAHRATHGDPFLDFDKLEPGDMVYLSQKDARWAYEITTEPEIIMPDEKWILDDFAPGRWLTLTTCWPKYGSEKRMYIRAKLVDYD